MTRPYPGTSIDLSGNIGFVDAVGMHIARAVGVHIDRAVEHRDRAVGRSDRAVEHSGRIDEHSDPAVEDFAQPSEDKPLG
jgi:hypothetical protein